MVPRPGKRVEQLRFASDLRVAGHSWSEIARELRDHYGRGALAAMRLAHGWSQTDAATAWNALWPDEPRTFKNFSYWENWPGPTGHAPSLTVLGSLARLYECSVSDLLAGWGDHRQLPDAPGSGDTGTLAWQASNLDLHELTSAMHAWSQRLPDDTRRALLLKISTAAASAAASDSGLRPGSSTASGTSRLDGLWTSTYEYPSTSRADLFTSTHLLMLNSENGRVVGRSHPDGSGSRLELSLAAEGNLVTGQWTERTSPSGHYRAATYHGIVHLVLDPTSMAMTGMWLGVGKRYTIKSGTWRLERTAQPSGSAEPLTTATTVPGGSSAPAIIR